ncbi:N-lysine methyltransferase KMT5A [Pimephales promelas]|nr:N-lysine methyltransferase KMT5A [Pimephales promelas]
MIALIESERRREVNQNTVYMFDFIWQNKKWCIDAAHENTTLGRLVNDDVNPNCMMKKVIVEGKPHLCLFAAKDITPGEEISYDYGGSDWPWRKATCSNDDEDMVTIKNCSGDSGTTVGVSRHTVESLVDYSDSEDDILCSKMMMTSYKRRIN